MWIVMVRLPAKYVTVPLCKAGQGHRATVAIAAAVTMVVTMVVTMTKKRMSGVQGI